MIAAPVSKIFDSVFELLNRGDIREGVEVLATALAEQGVDSEARPILWRHALHDVLLEDPLTERGFHKPRGHAGDAVLLDMIYDRRPAAESSSRGRELFSITSASPIADSFRRRLIGAELMLDREWRAGKRICALGCGHWREADQLQGRDLSNLVAVDRDARSLERIWQLHAGRVVLYDAGALSFLRRAASEGETFDCIYVLGLVDALDDGAVGLLMQSMRDCLSSAGTILIGALQGNRCAAGWMDAVMDWRIACRSPPEMQQIAATAGLRARAWRDPAAALAWCELDVPR